MKMLKKLAGIGFSVCLCLSAAVADDGCVAGEAKSLCDDIGADQWGKPICKPLPAKKYLYREEVRFPRLGQHAFVLQNGGCAHFHMQLEFTVSRDFKLLEDDQPIGPKWELAAKFVKLYQLQSIFGKKNMEHLLSHGHDDAIYTVTSGYQHIYLTVEPVNDDQYRVTLLNDFAL